MSSRNEQYRDRLNSRLLAVTFIPGGQGSFFTSLLQNSLGVAKYTRTNDDPRLDRVATAHVGNEQWLSHCHHWDQAELLDDDYFFNNLSDKLLVELDGGSGLIPFRCHPAVTQRLLDILPDLKILYIDHMDFYKPYRLYYEKLIKPLGNEWFVDSFYRVSGHKPKYLTDEIRVDLLSRWFDHTKLTAADFPSAYVLNADVFFQCPWIEYNLMIDHWDLGAMDKEQFDGVVAVYQDQQLALPVNDIFEEAVEAHKYFYNLKE